tara:strand:+ start:324 stop:1154 length:831 start_codon:yes stop_codon:yes gene_type:complete
MKLLFENWRRYLNEASVLPGVVKASLKQAMLDSKFWLQPHRGRDVDEDKDEITDEGNSLLKSPATRALEDALNKTAEDLGTELDFVITATGDSTYYLKPDGPYSAGYPNNWLMHGTYSGPINGKHVVWIELRPLHDEYNVEEELDENELVSILSRTINHELVHYLQLKKQADSRNISDEEAWEKLEKDPKQIARTSDRGEYLSLHNEIDAFAHEAAEELLSTYSAKEALDLIKTRDSRLAGVVRDYLNVLGNKPKKINKFWTKLYTQIMQQSNSHI